ncbi:hypothetical protein CHS0354_003374 [Potamilus streckersoni]|nr:hypothetical protein CHS0354_003374 [Potamilus streckersoni]
MASNKKLSLSNRFGIIKPSKSAKEEDTCKAANSFRDEYIKIMMTRQPTTDCFSSSMLFTSDDEELDFKMEDSWNEHFKTCLKGNMWSKKERAKSANLNDNIAKALKTAQIECSERQGCWKENCCQNQLLGLFKAVEKVDISFKSKIPEEIERSDIVATGDLENTEGINLDKNQNKGKMQENCNIISESKTCFVEEMKRVRNRMDEKIVSCSSLTKRKRLSDEESEESYVGPLDPAYEAKLTENSSVCFQKKKIICDLRTRFNDALLKQPRFYPCQNDGSINQGDIRRNSSVYRNGFEQDTSQTVSSFLNNSSMSDVSNCPQESVTSTQNLSHNLVERDLGIIMKSPSGVSSSETSNYNSTLSHGYTSNSQDNVSELELLERTLNVPSGFYARKIRQNTYKPSEMSQSKERSFTSMAPGFYRESDHTEKSSEGSLGKEELFQTLLQQCTALVHTKEDQKALQAVISLISQQAGGNIIMNQDARISNAETTKMNKEQPSEKDIVAESCHSTTTDDSTEFGLSLEEALSSSHKKEDLFEGRTLLKGGVKPRHIPKTYIPKPNREPPLDPRRRLDIDKKVIISLPLPKFCAETFNLKKARQLNVSFKPEKFELLGISCSPKNKSCGGEVSISDYIVHDGRSVSSKPLVEDNPAVLGTPVKDERCETDLMNQMTTCRIYGKLNLNKGGSASVMNKSSLEMEATENMNHITDKEYDGMQQNLCHTRKELMDKTGTNSMNRQERNVSEGRDKLPALNTKNEIDYVMESVSQLLTSLRDKVTAGLEQAKVEELEELHITKMNTLEMTIPIKEKLKENVNSTDDKVIKSDKVMSSTNENKLVVQDFVQMPTFNKECMKSMEISVPNVVKTMTETSIVDAAKNEYMEHEVVTDASSVTLNTSISNTAVNVHESVKASDISKTATEKKPLVAFMLNTNPVHSNETSLCTQVHCGTIDVPTNEEVFGSKHNSIAKGENIKEKLNREVQTSIDLSKGQPFCDNADFQNCKLYDPSSPTETVIDEVSMELDSSMEEGEIKVSLKLAVDISPDAAENGDEKGCKALEVMRSKWKETFYTLEREKEGESSGDDLVLRKTPQKSVMKDVEDFGGSIIGSNESCGTSKSQVAKKLRSSNHNCCDSQDSKSRSRCKTSQSVRKGSNHCEDSHRKSHMSKKPRSRSGSSTRVQDAESRPKRKKSSHGKDRHKRSKRLRSRSRSSSNCIDSDSRDRWRRSHSKTKYDRDRSWNRHSPSKDEYSRHHSLSRSHCCHHNNCQSKSVRDPDRSLERSPSDDSHKRHFGTLTKDRGEDTQARCHMDRKRHKNSLNNQFREDHVVIHSKDSDSNRSSAYSECSQSPTFHFHSTALEDDVEKRYVKKCRERLFKSTEQLETSDSDIKRLSKTLHTKKNTCRDHSRQLSQLDWTSEELVQMRKRSYECQEWQYSYGLDTFEGNNIVDYECDSIPKMYMGKFANKC